jgi:nucleoside-triphosphatase THEP1
MNSNEGEEHLVSGFITEECREWGSDGGGGMGNRTGFDVVTLPPPGIAPKRGPLARRNAEGTTPPKGTPSVGKYAVDVTSFETLAIPSISASASAAADGLHKRARVTVVDEVGKMEMFGEPFMTAVWDALADPSTTVLGRDLSFLPQDNAWTIRGCKLHIYVLTPLYSTSSHHTHTRTTSHTTL